MSQDIEQEKRKHEKPEQKWSRPAKRELKKIDTILRTLIITFLEFRLKQIDKENDIVANKLAQLEAKWFSICHKKHKYVTPKREAFAIRIEKILANEKSLDTIK